MSEEVVQWLEEIRSLQSQLTEAQRDREAAQASADHWRELYNTEARQRRSEAKAAQEAIAVFEQELSDRKPPIMPPSLDPPKMTTFAAELAPLKTEEQLRKKLVESLHERDRAREALRQEQENHRHTRQNLTAVIGDTMDQLSRLRGTPPPTLDPNSDEPIVEVLPPPAPEQDS